MKILVTGAAGFIGSNLCEHLLEQGHQVVGIDNFNDYYSPKIKEFNISSFKDNPNFFLYKLDLVDASKVSEVFEEHGPFTAIVHLAAWAGVTYSVEKPLTYLNNNEEATLKLAQLAVTYDSKNFIFASTSSIYGDNPTPFEEDMVTDRPNAPYPATKKGSEVMLWTFTKNFDLHTTIFRIFNPLGKRQRPDLFLSKLIRSCEYGTELPLYWDTEELEKTARDYTYIGHLFEAFDHVISNPNEYEIFNLGNSAPVTLGEVIRTTEKVIGKSPNTFVSPKSGEMLVTYANISKARQHLGYNPTTSLEEMVKIYYDWFMQQPDWYKKGEY